MAGIGLMFDLNLISNAEANRFTSTLVIGCPEERLAMPRQVRVLIVLGLCLAGSRGFADIAAIHAGALPQETAVLAALDDARQLEPYSSFFAAQWNFPVTKDEVSARLGKDLGFLRAASNEHPDNGELLLLTGLVARYAYNVDVEHSLDTAMDAFEKAEKITPSDVRAPWFRSTLQCQTLEPVDGAKGFLTIEKAHDWQQLPAAFWDDYLECAMVTNMPAHALRASDHLKELHAPESHRRDSLAQMAAKRFDQVDLTKQYDPRAVWTSEKSGDDADFTSTACGVRVHAHEDWTVDQIGLNRGVCVVIFSTGPYQATTRQLKPSVMLMVGPPKGGESLEEFAVRMIKRGSLDVSGRIACPLTPCLIFKANQGGMYGKDGEGKGRLVAFERDEPPYPGLALEAPHQMPKADEKAGAQYYRPGQTKQRIAGKLYYVVLLDTASSIEQPALKDFDFFLKNLVVE
jgi:hypothetical protein